MSETPADDENAADRGKERRDGGRPDRGRGAPRRDDAGSSRSGQQRQRPRTDGKAAPRRDGKPAPRRDAAPRDGERPFRPRTDRSGQSDRSSSRGYAGGRDQGGSRGQSPDRGRGGNDRGRGRDEKLWTRDGRPARGDRDSRERDERDERRTAEARELQSVRPRHDDPEIPETVQARDLDKEARVELKSLSKDNADWVARHLVMASQLIEQDPALAHQHALSAARRAGRIAVVRETLAITAYATGDFALALRELRTCRRISGSNVQLPLMVDSERGVGRPDRALELGRSVDRSTLPTDVQVSLAIAMSGARLDLGQPEAALAELEIPQLDPNRAFNWSPDLFYAYAEVLEELGRSEEAETWRERADRAEAALAESHASDEHETVHIVEEEVSLPDTEPGSAEGEEPDHGPVPTDE